MSHHHTRLLKLFTSATLPSVSLSLSLSLPLSPSFPLASPLPLNAAWSTNLAKAYGAYGVSHTRIIAPIYDEYLRHLRAKCFVESWSWPTCTRLSIQVCVCVCVYACVCVCLSWPTCTRLSIQVCVHECVCVCMVRREREREITH